MQDELDSSLVVTSRVISTELQERLNKLEEKIKPSLMKFRNQLEKEGTVDEDIIEETVVENNWGKVMTVLKKRMTTLEDFGRLQLVGLMRVVLSVRNCLVEKDSQEGVEIMQEMAGTILKQMGRSTIDWLDMREWEVKVMKALMREVEGIPGFVQSMVDQLLDRQVVEMSTMGTRRDQ